MIIIITVTSIAPYLTDKDEHTAVYKSNNNVYIKTATIINYLVIELYSSRAHTRTQT